LSKIATIPLDYFITTKLPQHTPRLEFTRTKRHCRTHDVAPPIKTLMGDIG
jgi:hypothetical protein